MYRTPQPYLPPPQAIHPVSETRPGRFTAASATLADLRKGERARIESVNCAAGASVLRLMTLGLVEGAELTFVGASIGGDPLEFRLYGSAISLRREQARQFAVSRIETA